MNKLNKNIFNTFLTQGITQILGIIAGIFITRLLGPTGRGVYTIFLSDVGLFTMLFCFSINSAIIFNISGNKIDIRELQGISVVMLIIGMSLTLLLTGIILLSHASVFFIPGGYDSFFYILYFLVSVFIGITGTIIIAFFQGYKYFNIINKIALINSILNVVVFSLTFIFCHNKFNTREYVILVFSFTILILLIYTFILIYFLRKETNIILSPVFAIKKHIKPFIKYLGIMHLSIILNFLNYRMDIWIINYYLKITDVGIYSLAVNMSQLALFITLPITTILMPHLTGADNENRYTLFKWYSKINFSFILFANCLLFFLANFIIMLLYGKEFTSAAMPFRLLLFGSLLIGLTKMCGVYIFSINVNKYNLLATTIGFIFTLAFDLLLIPIYGIIGACFASIISYSGIFIVCYFTINKFTGWKFENIFILTFTDLRKIYQDARNK